LTASFINAAPNQYGVLRFDAKFVGIAPVPSVESRALCFFLLLFVLYWKAPENYIGTNPSARFNLTKAIVFDHSLIIDKYVEKNMDWSKRDGHYYTNKAPGSSLVVLPFYAAFVAVEKAMGLDPLEHELDIQTECRADVFATALPSVLLSFFLLRYLLSKLKQANAKSNDAWIAVFTFAVGTIAFLYSTQLWGHQTASAFLFLCFYFLVRGQRLWLAGAFFGMAVLTEYTTLLASPALVAYLLLKNGFSKHKLKTLLEFAIGGLPFAIVFFTYHKIAFGEWTAMPMDPRFANPYLLSLGEERLFGVYGFPSMDALYGITFGTDRGLFFLSPILLLSALGFCRWFRVKTERAEASVCLWWILVCTLVNICFNGWHGGFCAGPRYLTPMLPFLCAPLLWVKKSWLYFGLLAVSALNMIAIAAVDIQPPPCANLLRDKIYPELLTRPDLWARFAFMIGVALILFTLAATASEKDDDLVCRTKSQF
jgi:hypothetical protein